MLRIVFGIALSAGFVIVSAPSWAADWRLEKYPNDKFQVEWSGPVKIAKAAVGTPTQKLLDHGSTYLQDNQSSAAYVVGATLVLPSSTTSLQGFANGSIKVKECKTIVKRSIDVKDAEAVEWIGTDCKNGWRVRSRFFNKGKWLYEATALVDSNGDVEAGKHFVESFKITDE